MHWQVVVVQVGSHKGTEAPRSDLFTIADRRLAFLQQRQIVLAQNIANANTPGWRASDVSPFEAVLAGKGAIKPVRTNAQHLSGHSPAGAGVIIGSGERSPDGNSVRLDEQLSKVADTETSQGTVANLYTKFLSFYRTALGR